jgi:fatty acid desaturase
MARARQTRRKKHRGTQAGTVRPRGGGRAARPRSRADARATAEQRRQEKLNRLPTWRAAIQRGGIAAAALFALLVIVFKTNAAAALPLSLLAALLYIPGFHLTDTLLYRARMRRRAREQARQREAAD